MIAAPEPQSSAERELAGVYAPAPVDGAEPEPAAIEAAPELRDVDAISDEVVDLRSLLPWDAEMVLSSVKKTGRCLILHEAPVGGGFGGEVAALETPVPAAQALEEIFSPKARLLPALRARLAY